MSGYLTLARCGVLGVCAALCGCSGPVERRPTALNEGDQGGSWEVIFPAGQAGQELAMGPEASRRDEALNYRDPGAIFDEDRPSLDDYRRLYLPHRADEVLYFGTSSPYYNTASYYRWRGY